MQLADENGEVSSHALAWRSSKLGPWPDGDSVHEVELSDEFLVLEREAIDSRATRSIREPSGDLEHVMWAAGSASGSGYDVLVSPFFSNEGVLIGLIILGQAGADSRWGDTSIVDFVAADLGRGVMSARLFLGQQRLVHQLQTLDRTRDEMLSTFSHELRTPLASIVAYAELLNEDPLMTSEDKHMIEVIERNAHRLSRLVEDVLSLSNFNAEILESELDEVAFDPIVQSAFDALSPTISRNITFTFTSRSPRTLVMANVSQIERLCFNIFTNAIKFTPDNGAVSVSTRRDGDEVVLTVADTGIGIDPDEMDLIFDRFYRGANAIDEVIPGTGLGLSIVAVIVRHHDGSIRVSPNLPHGTIVEIRLPVLSSRREVDVAPASVEGTLDT